MNESTSSTSMSRDFSFKPSFDVTPKTKMLVTSAATVFTAVMVGVVTKKPSTRAFIQKKISTMQDKVGSFRTISPSMNYPSFSPAVMNSVKKSEVYQAIFRLGIKNNFAFSTLNPFFGQQVRLAMNSVRQGLRQTRSQLMNTIHQTAQRSNEFISKYPKTFSTTLAVVAEAATLVGLQTAFGETGSESDLKEIVNKESKSLEKHLEENENRFLDDCERITHTIEKYEQAVRDSSLTNSQKIQFSERIERLRGILNTEVRVEAGKSQKIKKEIQSFSSKAIETKPEDSNASVKEFQRQIALGGFSETAGAVLAKLPVSSVKILAPLITAAAVATIDIATHSDATMKKLHEFQADDSTQNPSNTPETHHRDEFMAKTISGTLKSVFIAAPNLKSGGVAVGASLIQDVGSGVIAKQETQSVVGTLTRPIEMALELQKKSFNQTIAYFDRTFDEFDGILGTSITAVKDMM